MMVRALSYIYTHGAEGLKEATEAAVLNARYVLKIEGLPMTSPTNPTACTSDLLAQKAVEKGRR
jgi:glycine dehydrogenase subunit 2